jgi:hypothetical protein
MQHLQEQKNSTFTGTKNSLANKKCNVCKNKKATFEGCKHERKMSFLLHHNRLFAKAAKRQLFGVFRDSKDLRDLLRKGWRAKTLICCLILVD